MSNTHFLKDVPIAPGSTPVLPTIIYQSATQYTEGDAATETVATIHIDKEFMIPGTTFRVNMVGTKTGANAAQSAVLSLNGTAVLTLAADAGAAVDWTATMFMHIVSKSSQKCWGQLNEDTADHAVDYATGSVSIVDGDNILRVQMTNGHASDEITCEFVSVEYWRY